MANNGTTSIQAMNKVNPGYLAAMIATLFPTIKVKGDEPPAALAAKLEARYAEEKGGKQVYPKLAVCQVETGGCGGKSDPALDFCPFCGLGEEGKIDPRLAPFAKTPNGNGKGRAAAAVPAPQEAPPAAEESAPKVPTKKELKAQEKAARAAEVKAEKDAAKKASDEAKARAEDALVLAKKEEGDKLAQATGSLDEHVSRVRALMNVGAENYMHIGQAMKPIFDGQLWKARLGEDGKVAYRSFKDFCLAEFDGLTDDRAYKMIDVAAKFDEATVKRLGTSKLEEVVSAPESAQKKILKAVEEGATYRETRTAVREAKAKEKKPRETGRSARTAAATAKSAEKSRARAATAKTITVANIEGTKTIKLWHAADGDKPAKRLADAPHGTLDLENGVVQTFALRVGAGGQLCLQVRTKRESK